MTKHTKKKNVDFINHNLHKDAMFEAWRIYLLESVVILAAKMMKTIVRIIDEKLLYTNHKIFIYKADDLKYQELVSWQENGIK